VFLVTVAWDSLLQLFHASKREASNANRAPLLEVRGEFAEFPKRGFSLAPEDFLLDYLCRFTVRVPKDSLEDFSARGVCDFTSLALSYDTSGNMTHRICLADPPYIV